jgi:hypothetical protein
VPVKVIKIASKMKYSTSEVNSMGDERVHNHICPLILYATCLCEFKISGILDIDKQNLENLDVELKGSLFPMFVRALVMGPLCYFQIFMQLSF